MAGECEETLSLYAAARRICDAYRSIENYPRGALSAIEAHWECEIALRSLRASVRKVEASLFADTNDCGLQKWLLKKMPDGGCVMDAANAGVSGFTYYSSDAVDQAIASIVADLGRDTPETTAEKLNAITGGVMKCACINCTNLSAATGGHR